jgi:hypothetical protein
MIQAYKKKKKDLGTTSLGKSDNSKGFSEAFILSGNDMYNSSLKA